MMITMSKLENVIKIKNHIYFTENTQKRTLIDANMIY